MDPSINALIEALPWAGHAQCRVDSREIGEISSLKRTLRLAIYLLLVDVQVRKSPEMGRATWALVTQ